MLGKILITLAVLYLVAGVGFRFVEHRFLFHPTAEPLANCALPQGVEYFRFGDEQALLTRTGSNKLMVFYHGNGSDACNWRFIGPNHLAPFGYDTLVVEFPGYAGDGRVISKASLLATAEATHLWAQEHYDEVSVLGYSMGSAAASHHAGQGGVTRLILFAAFDSMYALLRGKGYWYPRFLLRNDFDNRAALAGGPPETIVVHGAVDTLIPPARGRKLAEALGARFILRDGFGHDGLFDSPAFDEFLADVLGSR